MPRFQEAYVRLLKQTMLQRLPNCEFTKEDISLIASDTELDEVQIVMWATNFRARFTSLEDRERFLRNTAEKVRFPEAYVRLLKHTMLQRLPKCEFTKDDVVLITNDTRLEEVQILQWATNIRARYSSLEECKRFLRDTANKVLIVLLQAVCFE